MHTSLYVLLGTVRESRDTLSMSHVTRTNIDPRISHDLLGTVRESRNVNQ